MRRTLLGGVAIFAALTGRVAADGQEAVKRFGFVASAAGAPTYELRLDAENEPLGWLLLGVPAVDQLAAAAPRSEDLMGDEPARPRVEARTGPISYGLADNWSAAISYHHELLFPTAAGKDLRSRRFSLFASQPNRDVLDVTLGWRLSWSEINFGYQLQSDRAALAAAAQSYSIGGFVDETAFDYALTIGITRRFGGSK